MRVAGALLLDSHGGPPHAAMQSVVETPDYLRDAKAAGIGDDIPVFLLNVFKKEDRVNLSKAEINALREELSHLAREYREGAMRHVKGR